MRVDVELSASFRSGTGMCNVSMTVMYSYGGFYEGNESYSGKC